LVARSEHAHRGARPQQVRGDKGSPELLARRKRQFLAKSESPGGHRWAAVADFAGRAADTVADERQTLQDEKAAPSGVLQVRKQLDDKTQAAGRIKYGREAGAGHALDKAELQKKLDDVSGQLTEAQRKNVSGIATVCRAKCSNWPSAARLSREFPLDSIRGGQEGGARRGCDSARGDASGANRPGIILWEAKRAKDWSPQLGSRKLKEEQMRSCGARDRRAGHDADGNP